MSSPNSDSSLDLFLVPIGEGQGPPPAARDIAYLAASDLLPPSMGGPPGLNEAAAAARGEKTASGIWLEGEVLMCACPDCAAPMTIRVWLMVADCWRCGTSIELSEEQERDVERLMARQQAAEQQAAAARPVEKNPAPAPRPQAAAAVAAVPQAPPAARPAATNGRSVPATNRPSRTRQRMRELARAGSVRAWVSDMFRDTPSWLISLVAHLVILTILGLLLIESSEDDPIIRLSTLISSHIEEGGTEGKPNPEEVVSFDLPVPENTDLEDEAQVRAMQLADQDARELRVDPETPDPNYADLETVREQIGSASSEERMVLTRDPRLRVEMVQREGGTTHTEAAVARALRWLSRHQFDDGSWHLNDFQNAPNAGGNSGGQGNIQSNSAATSLALLPFLGAGQTHLTGNYKDQVSMGLRWLIDHQKEDGDLRADSAGNSGMYAHGQSTIVLCEAYAMTQDEALRAPAQKALDFIVAAQHGAGGWRYQPGQPGDTSVLGWQLMGLQSGLTAGLSVPEVTLMNADHFLDSVSSNEGSRYAYTPGAGPTHVMTAEALLCRIYLGWKRSEPGLASGVNYLTESHPPDSATHMYYWYYATQVMHHYGGEPWEEWNEKMRDVLVNSQETVGPAAGSWAPSGGHAAAGGRLYMTALAACTLEVYYRHAPIFRAVDLDE